MTRGRLILIIFIVLLPLNVDAQKKRTLKADEAYNAGEFFEAIDLYKDAYSVIQDKQEKSRVVFQIAECYRKTNDSKRAELWYKKALGRDYTDPIAQLRYAEAMKMNLEYEEAINEFKRYKELVPSDPRADNGILSCELALQWMENPLGYEVQDIRYFNSRGIDFSPAYARDDYQLIYFTSSRDEAQGNKTHGATGEDFTDIFESRLDRKGKWSVPVPLGEPINSEFEDGTPSFTDDYNTIYFSRCEVSKRKTLGCKIFFSTRQGEKWGEPKPLEILADSLIAAHPSISVDELTLYFVSDIEGGFGGKDIWKVTRENASADWGKPINMGGDINTEGDEVFPYIHPDGILYFSSNGHIGMGGLDIFRATMQENNTWKIENMQYPINSFADDFGIVFEKEVERGFFTSSRKGRGNDDIFSFVMPPLKFNLTGVVRDEKSDDVIPGSVVKLIGSDGVNIQAETGNDGSFRFILQPNTDYVFVASKQGYLNGKGRETTKGQDQSRDFSATIYLASIAKPIELSNSNVFYDFAKWDLRPEAMVSLDKLVETLNDNPNVTIELMSHTDSRDTEEFNLDLSQRRAQSVVDYLIEKGISPDRLSAKGYGESMPKEVTSRMVENYTFLREGDVLTEEFINNLVNIERQEIAHQMNRRTEFRVLTIDYNTDDQ
ncbi:MAG: OmpA family protein [Bacteroidales bacterium]|nr:MAG: OmpA family protein [Bacteroidales bacterium]